LFFVNIYQLIPIHRYGSEKSQHSAHDHSSVFTPHFGPASLIPFASSMKYQGAAVTRLLNRQIRTTEFFVTIAVQFRLWHLDPTASGRRLGWGWGLVFAHDNHNCNIMQPSLELTNPSSSYACALRSLAEVWHTACFRQFFGDAKPDLAYLVWL
jgi:hypothetical protein